MSYCGYVVKVEKLRPHSNADRLQVATFFGNDTIVDLKTHVGDMGVYFPSDGQLSEKYCQVNDLVRRKDENGNPAGGYMDPDKRNVKAIKLRGEKSDGLYMPLTSLMEFCTISDLKVGDKIDVLNGEEICRKYIPRSNGGYARKSRGHHKPKQNICPTFFEHVETEQLAYNLDKFYPGDVVQLTLKMHGSSGRTGYLPVRKTHRTWIDKLLRRHGKDYFEYDYVTGSRRVVLSPDHETKAGYYDSDEWRYAMTEKFMGKLNKNETVYYEIVGFQGPNGAPIMSQCSNVKVKDKEFTKQYGDVTTFSYGCEQDGDYDPKEKHIFHPEAWESEPADAWEDDIIPPCCEVYVYRMTMVNEDGDVVEYSPAQIKTRCEQMGVNTVMEFETFQIPPFVRDEDGVTIPVVPGEYVTRKVEQYYDGPDPIGKTHVREGVVARILNRPKFEVYKHKNMSFKILEGIIKEEATAPDIEEAQELEQEEVEQETAE